MYTSGVTVKSLGQFTLRERELVSRIRNGTHTEVCANIPPSDCNVTRAKNGYGVHILLSDKKKMLRTYARI